MRFIFSRAPISWKCKEFSVSDTPSSNIFLHHLGIYSYRVGFIKKYISWKPSLLEQIEKLEQLRVLWYGKNIHVAIVHEIHCHGVNTQKDLEQIQITPC